MKQFYILFISILITSLGFGQTTIVVQDFDGGAPAWSYNSDIEFFDNVWGSDGYYGLIDISAATPIDQANMSGNILGENDLADEGNGTSGFATLSFDTIVTSDFTDVVVSFDWEVIGYNANNDDAKYEVFLDGVGQGDVFLLDGNGALESDEGTENINIPNGTLFIRLEVKIRNDGVAGFSGFDNFKVTGIYSGLAYSNGTWTPSEPNGATGSSSATIFDGVYTLSADASVQSFIVKPGAGLIIDSGVTLTGQTVDLESNSTQYASLKLDGTLDGTLANSVTYRRYVNEFTGVGGNDLITSPVTNMIFGELIEDVENFDLIYNDGDPDFTTFAFGPFDNDTPNYTNYIYNVNFPGDSDDYFETLLPQKGYRAATIFSTTLLFRGGVNSGSVSTTDFDNYGATNPSDEMWNLVGNAYPSFLDAQLFLSTNSSVIDSNFAAIYGYNDSTDDNASGIWTIINDVQNTNIDIAPGQGFFLASNGSGQLSFTPTMRLISGGDDFIIGRNASSINHVSLKVANQELNSKTDIYFTGNGTKGLDPGSDAGMINVSSTNFSLFTELVEENNGIDMAIQTLGQEDMNDVVIPLGLKVSQGQQLTFSLYESDLPETINIYLEDNLENQWTLLNTNDYVFTPSSDLDGTGRFFVHFTTSTLSAEDTLLSGLQIFADNASREVVIKGQLSHETTAVIYDLQGRQVMYQELNNALTTNKINVNSLSTGLYIVEISDYNKKRTHKVIIK